VISEVLRCNFMVGLGAQLAHKFRRGSSIHTAPFDVEGALIEQHVVIRAKT
jgi:hypothetical protein